MPAAARRRCPLVFSEMSPSTAAPKDALATYFVGVRISERRQSVGLGLGQPRWQPKGACLKKAPLHKGLWSSQGFLIHFEILYCLKSSIEGSPWPWNPLEYTIGATKDDAVVQKADAGHSREEFLNGGPRNLNGPGKRSRLRAAYFGRQVLARRTGPYVLNESCQPLPGGCAQWCFLRCACPRLPRRTCRPRTS